MLLVIFIITTIPPVKDVALKLPKAAKHEKDPPHKANYIILRGHRQPVAQQGKVRRRGAAVHAVQPARDDPDLNVIVRGDANTKYKQIRAVLDACQPVNVPKVDLATEPARNNR